MRSNHPSLEEKPSSPSGEPTETGIPAKTATSPLRWKEIADSVRGAIESGHLAAGDSLPSETALALEWKVSRMTAHRAMQELQRIGLVTRKPGLGTLVSEPAPTNSGHIALLFHNPLDGLELEYLRGINAGLSRDQHILFCDSHADVEEEARTLRKMRKEADGIICLPSCHPKNTPLLREISDSGFPIVCVDRTPENVEIDAVVSNNFQSSTQALNALVKRGHKKIVHFTEDEMRMSSVRERFEAFVQVMRQNGETHPERLVRFFPIGSAQNFDSRVQLMHDALFTLRHGKEPPTAIFCLNDHRLMPLLTAIEQLELRVPEDIEVLSFHDAFTFMPSVLGRLHRIVQDPKSIGMLAAQRLQSRIHNKHLPREIVRVSATIYAPGS